MNPLDYLSNDGRWWLGTAVLALGLMAALVWYFRQVSLRRLPAPGFFLIALAFHALLGVGSFYIYVDEGAAPRIQEGWRKITVATRATLANLRGTFRSPEDNFAEVAEPKAVKEEGLAPVPIAARESPQTPLPPEAPPGPEPLHQKLPARFTAPPEEVLGGPDIVDLARHRPPVDVPAEPIEIEPLPSAQPPAEEKVEKVDMVVDRRPPGKPVRVEPLLPPSAPGRGEAAGSSPRGVLQDSDPEKSGFVPVPEVMPLRRRVHLVPDAPLEDRAEMLGLPPAGRAARAKTDPDGVSPPVAIHLDRQPRRPAGPPTLPRTLLPPADPMAGSGRVARVNQKTEIDPATAPLDFSLPQRQPRSPGHFSMEENIGLEAMFSHRRGDVKREAVQEFGGSPQTVAGIRRGLDWLKRHQHADGFWSLDRFHNEEPGQNYAGRGWIHSDLAATGLALLPFLGDGHTHLSGEYTVTVRKGLEWLVKQQQSSGDLTAQSIGNPRMYAQAIGTIALCEAYGMSKAPELREPAQRAIDFIVKAQHRASGGWRYQPNEFADMSVVGWEVMALKSGQMANLNIPQASLDLVPTWLNQVEGKDREVGRFRYQPGRRLTPAMTAEALLCAQYLGADRNHPRLQAGAAFLLQHLPKKGQESSYYWYYATQVMYHMQGDYWKQWNAALRDLLVQTQRKDSPLSGTWDPSDQWEHQAGRIYATSLRLLMLEVYYRHLPLYQVLQD